MRVLNIGFDKTLAGGKGVGDAVERHREYGQYLDSLDIIVYTTLADGLTEPYKISDKVTGFPTNSSSRLGFVFDVLRLAKKIYSTRAFDIVVAQDPLAAGLAGYVLKRKYACKLQINFHGDYWEDDYWKRKSFGYRILIAFSKFWVPKADGIRVVSTGIKKKLLKADIPESKIAVLPTPVNFRVFSEPSADAANQVRNRYAGKALILFAGRLEPEKNLSGMLDAFQAVKKQLPETVLLLVGHGAEESGLKARVKKLDLKKSAYFLGQLDSSELATHMSACDVFVLPSHTESFGKVLIEAALAGKPAVATATTGAQEIIENGKSGYLVPIGDMKQFTARVIDILQNPAQAKKMGEHASQLVREKFKRDNIVKGIVDFWRQIAEH